MEEPIDDDSRLRVALIEDCMDLRTLLTEMLAEIRNVVLVGCADTERAAIAMLRATEPDLALIDLELAEGNGLNVLRDRIDLVAPLGLTRAVVFSNFANAIIREKCRTLGASAFFDKSFQMDELISYIDAEAQRKAGGGSAQA